MTETPPPTMQTVADVAGVSRATVSRALSNHPSLPAATRRRIQDVALKLGYRPNPLVAALMAKLKEASSSRHKETIAYVTAWPTREGWRRSYESRSYFEGAEERAGRLGYKLEHFWLKDQGMSSRRLSQILATRAIRGVVIGPLLRPIGHLSLDWPNIAAVTLGSSLRKPDLHRISAHQFYNVNLAYRQLWHRGYRRIGLLTFEHLEKRVDFIRDAAIHAQQRRVRHYSAIPSLLLKKWSLAAFRGWLQKTQPDAVIGVQYLDSITTAELFSALPKKIGFATLNWSEDYGDVAGVHLNPQRIGMEAVNLVVEQLNHNELGIPAHPKTVLIHGIWKDGTSVRRLRTTAKHKRTPEPPSR